MVAGAEALRAMLEGGDAIARNYQIVMDREHDADNVTREVLIAVRRTFITPFDRGNIRDLITSMDNSIDQMQKTAKAVKLFDVTTFTPQMKDMADAIVKCAAAGAGRRAAAAIDQRRGRPHQRPSPQQISALEGRADELHDVGLRELYQANAAAGQGAGLLRRQRGLRPSGEGGRPLRRRRQRDARHRHRARLSSGAAEDTMDASARTLPLLVALIVVALAFDFLNGLHDAANSIATIVSTRVLRPQYAVAWAAFFNFIAFLFFGLHVAETVGRGIVAADVVDPRVIFGALMGAISWNLITWYYGIPSSSSHALIGGLIGAGIAKAGLGVHRLERRHQDRLGDRAVAADRILAGAAPDADRVVAVRALDAVSRSTARSAICSSSRPRSIRSGTAATTRRRPWASSPCCSTRRATWSGGFHVPFWVVITCQAMMGLGTLVGGWRIVKTMGSKITRLTPMQGFCAETGGSITLFAATWLGIPVSTTHTITGCIVGVGAAKRMSAVRWSVASNIVYAWIITMPASAHRSRRCAISRSACSAERA